MNGNRLAPLGRRIILGGGASAIAALAGRPATAQSQTIRFGFLTDMSGPYSDISGPTGAVCARQAIEEFAGHGIDVEVIVADHQQKPDLGVTIVREWFDRGGVDVVLDVGNTAVALAIAGIVSDRNKVHLNTAAASSVLTGTACNANLIHWPYDTWCSANSTVRSILRSGGDRWFFITANYSFGKDTQADAWDLNERTRAFTNRVKPKLVGDNYPNMLHAAAYSATLHYLKVAAAMGVAQAKADGRATVAAMKAMPTEDDCFGPGRIRADGRKLHPAYLFQVKRPQDSAGPWDLLTLAGTAPADQAFRPTSDGHCSRVAG